LFRLSKKAFKRESALSQFNIRGELSLKACGKRGNIHRFGEIVAILMPQGGLGDLQNIRTKYNYAQNETHLNQFYNLVEER
jgi:hypothetical protein